ncbi:hypothetical protein NB705_003259 [Xanthomonas sacchari]|nr:hypothetical protein [Xanthomonas sacchari]
MAERAALAHGQGAVAIDVTAAGGVEHRARGHPDRAALVAVGAAERIGEAQLQRVQGDASAIDEGAALRVLAEAPVVVDPAPAHVQARIGTQQQVATSQQGIAALARVLHGGDAAGALQGDAARVRGQRAVDLQALRLQRQRAAIDDLQGRTWRHLDHRRIADRHALHAAAVEHARGQLRPEQRIVARLGLAGGARQVRRRRGQIQALRPRDRTVDDLPAAPIAADVAVHRGADAAVVEADVAVDAQGAAVRQRAAGALVAAGQGLRGEIAGQHGHAQFLPAAAGMAPEFDVQRACVAALQVVAFVVAAAAEQGIGEGLADAPARVRQALAAGDAEIAHRRIGIGQVVQASIGAQQARGFDDPAEHVHITAVQPHLRPRRDRQVARADVDGAAVQQHLIDIARHLVDIALRVQQRTADPGLAVGTHAAGAPVEPQRLAQQRAIALQRRIGQFVLAHARDLHQVAVHRHLHVGDAGHIQLRAAVEQDAVVEQGAAAQQRGFPAQAEQIHAAAGGEGQRLTAQGHLRAGQDHLRPEEGQVRRRAGGGGLAVAFGQDRGDGPRRQLQGAALVVDQGAAAELVVLVDRQQHHAARAADAGGGLDQAALLHLIADQGGVAARGGDDAAVVEPADPGAVAAHRRDEVAEAQRRHAAAGAAQQLLQFLRLAQAQHCRQQRLAVLRGHAAGVADVRCGDQRVALAAAGQARATVDADIAGRAARGQAVQTAQHHAALAGAAEQATGQERLIAARRVGVEQIQRGHQQRVRGDLAGAAEQHAVAIEQIHLARGLDAAQDPARRGTGVVDPVERDPLRRVGAAGGLVELQVGTAADVEGFPVEDGLFLRLLDGDLGGTVDALLGRRARAQPDVALA